MQFSEEMGKKEDTRKELVDRRRQGEGNGKNKEGIKKRREET